ncbi:flagellar assembly peptidoglycan hydrolase FlgJ [Chitinibacter sp. S2-10]|uniref:flagellar assembly peptidoglycan hydrolase FlgJ n=1 Tax=Chitinibacter sp. S2-10 TaxID=3373597 RepID=UPI0039775F39
MLPTATFDSQGLNVDPRSLDRLRAMSLTDKSAANKGVAQQFESLLLQQMLSAMRKAGPQDEIDQSAASQTFKSMRDQQWAQNWAQSGGIGFARMIERQLNIQSNPALLQQVQRNDAPSPIRKALPVNAAAVAAAAAKTATPFAAPAQTGSQAGLQAGSLISEVKSKLDAIPDFVSKLGDAAKTTAASLGVAPHLLLAQAALETGWGKKSIKGADGVESHNLFGIKAGAGWQGKTVDVMTTEYVDGIAQKRVEKFRAYDSYGESMADYAALLKRRYAGALEQGSDAKEFAKALANGGYATDPQYAQKLSRVAEQLADQLSVGNSRSRA